MYLERNFSNLTYDWSSDKTFDASYWLRSPHFNNDFEVVYIGAGVGLSACMASSLFMMKKLKK